MNTIRTLTAREIECRVAQIKKNGLQLLLYKDARCDMAILDETFGPMNWMRHHTRDNANCIISVYDIEKGQWIDKEDVGTESNTEAVKGLASDSFKRAGVNWGIGRELYTAPFIWVDKSNCKIEQDERNPNRFYCNDRFDVQEIGYDDHREINRLVIVNSKTHNVVYEYGTNGQNRLKQQPKPKAKEEPAQEQKTAFTGISGAVATPEQIEYIKAHASDDDYMDIMTRYGANLENLSQADAEREIAEIDKHNEPMIPTCERCGKAITGVALPDGSRMTASELIGKSKLTYNGVYCFGCMKELNRKKKAG